MMNDMVLDELLTQWKTERAPHADTFASPEYFEARFFAEAATDTEKRARARKKSSTLHDLIDWMKKQRPVFSGAAMECCCTPPAGAAMAKECYLGGPLMDWIAADDGAPTPNAPEFDTEEYKTVGERPFVAAAAHPLSTFGADVDTAMYANLRRMILEEHRLPPPAAVRLEEMINYFRYDYPAPRKGGVMRPHFEIGAAPWAPERQLLLAGLQAEPPEDKELPPSNYVFLVDNSGSMYNVMPMVKEALRTLVGELRPCDRVGMVTYGGEVRVLLEGCADPRKILKLVNGLEAEGCTPGGEGIQKAYALAEEHFIEGGNNRIVLITDGDFNVGVSSEAELIGLVRAKRESGVYLSIAGCGMGNYKDNKLKMLANKGNGNCFYIDREREAKRVFVHGMTGNMYALARDVKFQIEFNPEQVFAYRLIGYELRDMTDRDFRDDNKESGTVGFGQQVTALYELIPADAPEEVKASAVPPGPEPKYVKTAMAGGDAEFLTFHLRWRAARGGRKTREEAFAIREPAPAGANWNWTAAVAEFGLALRESEFAPGADPKHAAKLAQANLGDDADGSRAEFLLMARRAAKLRRK